MPLSEHAWSQFHARLADCRRTVEAVLDAWLPTTEEPAGSRLHEALRYAVFAGGKRLRPFLVMESCRVLGGRDEQALPAAAAVEALHTHSLVHDDLPCMDDDDLRRGKPTCHKVFGEGMALLCGDVLLTLSFEFLSTKLPEAGVDADTVLRCVRALSQAIGWRGLGGGQALDITEQADGYARRNAETVTHIHDLKTAAFMEACCAIGGLIARGADEEIAILCHYGRSIGLAFQITDDILDVTGEPARLGKTVGKDARQNKLTYPMVFGLEQSRCLASESVTQALQTLDPLDSRADLLRVLPHYLLERQS
jgi:geranylgeranyl diphosphate synthase type II